jgi:hypothetical protein
VATGKIVGRFKDRLLLPFALSPDGKRCATGDSSHVNLWDVATGQIIRQLRPTGDTVHSLTFSSDGRFVASGCSAGSIHLLEVASGTEVLKATGHRGVVRALAFAGKGDRRLASASSDTTVLVWDLVAVALAPRGADAVPSAEELDRSWADLAGESRPAVYRAQWVIRAAPVKALALLRERLWPVVAVPEQELRRLIGELENDRFAVRQRATQELARLGRAAEPALRATLKGKPTVELRRRVTDLLDRLQGSAESDRRRTLHCIEILEDMETRAARSLLERLAGGTPSAPETVAAKAALERLVSSQFADGRTTWSVITRSVGNDVVLWPLLADAPKTFRGPVRRSTGRHAVAAPLRCPVPTRTSPSP